MPSTPLVVAGVAALLLVVTIAVDVNFNRTIFVDMASTQGQTASWVTVAQEPCCRAYEHPRGPSFVQANRSDVLDFRVRVDNGYPWSYSSTYVVYVGGLETTRGVVEAAPRSEGVAEFTVPADAFLGPDPQAPPPEKTAVLYGSVEVEIGSERLYVHPGIQEVAR